MLLNVRFQEHSGRRLQRELLCWWATWRTAQRQSVRLCRGTLRQTTLKYARPVRRAIGRRSTRKPKARSTRRQKALRDPHHGVGQHSVVTLPPPSREAPILFFPMTVAFQIFGNSAPPDASNWHTRCNGAKRRLFKTVGPRSTIGCYSKLYLKPVQWLFSRGDDNGQPGLLCDAFYRD